MSAQRRRLLRRVLRTGQLGCLVWLVVIALQIVTAAPAAADNCSVFTDCFRQANSAAEATFGLALLAGLSLLIDASPFLGDAKGLYQAFSGRDLITGEELSAWDRALGMVPLIPVAEVARGARALDTFADLARAGGRGVDIVATVGRHADDPVDMATGAASGSRHADDLEPAQPGAGAGAGAGGAGQPPRRGGDGPSRGGDEPPPEDGPGRGAGDEPDPERLDELARDPAHGGRITPGSRQEARIAVDLDRTGRLPGLERDPSGGADFVEPNGQLWDVKGFNSAYANGYDLDSAMAKIADSLAVDENVILDATKMSEAHLDELRAAVDARPEWAGRILWWP